MAVESSEQRGQNANLYRLGVRLRAVELLIRYARDAAELAVACKYVRLGNHDIQCCDFASNVKWPLADARDLLQRLHRKLQSLRQATSETLEFDTDVLAKHAAEIAAIVRDSLSGVEADWFELGCAVVPLSSEFLDVPERSNLEWPSGDVGVKDARRRMTWANIRRLTDALCKTGVSLEECLVEPDYDDVDRLDRIGRFPDALWPLEWIERALEIDSNDGAHRNQQLKRDEEEPLRPASDKTLRNLYFLKWYQDESSETHGRPSKIRDRWNAAHPKAKIAGKARGNDTVKKGSKAAERFLQNNGVELYDAIKRLET